MWASTGSVGHWLLLHSLVEERLPFIPKAEQNKSFERKDTTTLGFLTTLQIKNAFYHIDVKFTWEKTTQDCKNIKVQILFMTHINKQMV